GLFAYRRDRLEPHQNQDGDARLNEDVVEVVGLDDRGRRLVELKRGHRLLRVVRVGQRRGARLVIVDDDIVSVKTGLPASSVLGTVASGSRIIVLPLGSFGSAICLLVSGMVAWTLLCARPSEAMAHPLEPSG